MTASGGPNGFKLVLVLSALTGFLSLGYEILWFRVLAFATLGLPASFGLLLGAYLFGIALGSRLAGRLSADAAPRFDVKVLRLLGVFIAMSTVAAASIGPMFGYFAQHQSWLLPLGLVGATAVLLGTFLPLLCHFGIEPDGDVGSRLSFVYLANIIGSTLGSFVTGFVLLDVLTAAQTASVLAMGGLMMSLAILWRSRTEKTALNVAIGALMVLLIAMTPLVTNAAWDRIYEKLLYKNRDDGVERFTDIIENRDGVIAVTNKGLVFGGGAYDGCINLSLTRDSNSIYRAYALAVMKPVAPRVLMIGLSSGSWARVIANLPGVEDLTVVEINPGYLELIRRYPEVAPVLTDPRIHLVIDDGRRWLNRHPDEKFDLVVMNTTWHWRSNITNLLSIEMMQLVKAHLKPDGLFYFNTTHSDAAQKTAVTAFAHGLRINSFMAVSDTPFEFNAEEWERTLRTAQIDDKFMLDTSGPEGSRVLMELLDMPKSLEARSARAAMESREAILERTQTATVITDDNMFSEWHGEATP